MKNLYKTIIKLRNLIPINNLEIYDLRNYYRLSNVVSEPENIKISNNMEIKGKVLAAKGNIVIFEDKDKLFSFNAHEILGMEIEL